MKKLILITILVSLLFLSCSITSDDLPNTIKKKDGKYTVKNVENFIKARRKVLINSANDYQYYAEKVSNLDIIPYKIFESGNIAYLNENLSTSDIVEEAIESSGGAYLNENDTKYLSMLADELEEDIDNLYEHTNNYFDSLSEKSEEILIDSDDLSKYFTGSYLAKKEILNLEMNLFDTISANLKAEMFNKNKINLWNNYINLNREYLNNYIENDSTPSIYTLARSAVLNSLKTKYGNKYKDSYWLEPNDEVKSEIIIQSYTYYSTIGSVLTILSQSGVVKYLGYDPLEELRKKTLKSFDKFKNTPIQKN